MKFEIFFIGQILNHSRLESQVQDFHSEFGNMNFKNFDRNQDLFLFFEENEDEKVINSRLASLYMNRFVIDEDYQNEIGGGFYLQRVDPAMLWNRSDQYLFAEQILDCAFNDEFLLKQYEKRAHFIIASDFSIFYSLGEGKSHWIEKWLTSKLETLISQATSFAVTVLSGKQKPKLASNSLVKRCYEPNQLFDKIHWQFFEFNTVNNDLETREDQIRQLGENLGNLLSLFSENKSNVWYTSYGKIHINHIRDSTVESKTLVLRAKLISQYTSLWLYQMLNDSKQDTLLKKINVSFEYDNHENRDTCRLNQIYACERLTMFFLSPLRILFR